MPLNILLADDSVPAQNMGKKILTDAGYHVLAVSNGLEALRKIAETIPDIAILDIFMPGYTGLEICERLRANVATATLPVILTVGKLEPYRPQDGEQVHSNAVIVKPFAAAELISAVRSLIGAPEVAAESNPQFGVDRHAADAGADPLQKSLTDGQPAQNQAGAWQEEVPDEPLFSVGPSATRQDELPLAPREPTGHIDEPFLADIGLDEPESLVFNPDTKHIPFSASAIDLVASHPAAENDASGFTEFDLEPVPSHYSAYSAAAGEGFAAMDESSQAAAAVADAEPDTPVSMADSALGEAAELEAPDTSFLYASGFDSLLEVPEASTSTGALGLTILGVGEASKKIDSEVDAATIEGVSTRPTAVLVQKQEEEERRRAFEVLFNSPQPFTEESSLIESEGSSVALLPSMADLSENHPFDVAPDTEIVSLSDNNRSEFVAPEPDPYLMQEGEPASAIPERDPLLENDLEASWAEPVGAAQPVESVVKAAGELYSPQAEKPDELTAPSPFDAVLDETQNVVVETHAVEPEILAPEYPAEVVPSAPEAADGETQFVSELLQTASEAPVAPPQFVSEVLLPRATNATPEEGMDLETEAETASVQSELTEPQPEMHLAENAPEDSLQSSEAERVRQAVDRVFDRFKRLLVAAIVRELARHD